MRMCYHDAKRILETFDAACEGWKTGNCRNAYKTVSVSFGRIIMSGESENRAYISMKTNEGTPAVMFGHYIRSELLDWIGWKEEELK